jgi:hypothetical protein
MVAWAEQAMMSLSLNEHRLYQLQCRLRLGFSVALEFPQQVNRPTVAGHPNWLLIPVRHHCDFGHDLLQQELEEQARLVLSDHPVQAALLIQSQRHLQSPCLLEAQIDHL